MRLDLNTKQKNKIIKKNIRSYKSIFWYMGFGYKPFLIIIILLSLMIFSDKEDHLLLLILILIVVAYMIHKFIKWNFPKWKREYNKGLLIFPELKKLEDTLSHDENRDYNVETPLLALSGIMLNDYEGKLSHSLLNKALELEGNIYLDYLKKHINSFVSNFDENEFIEVEKNLRKHKLNACMIIIQVIEIKYGSIEATKLAIYEYENY